MSKVSNATGALWCTGAPSNRLFRIEAISGIFKGQFLPKEPYRTELPALLVTEP
jgi:hypothetical protein